jgi:putative membrane protein
MLAFLSACSSAKDSAKFAPVAAQGGMAEVEMGQLAIQRAADPAVKEFGQRMVTDHSRAGAELKTIASRKQIQLPTEISSSQKSMVDKLSKLSGAEFDKEYMSGMVKDPEEDAKEFQTQSNEGNDPDIKAFAAKTLPIIQEHLQMARTVAKKVGAN